MWMAGRRERGDIYGETDDFSYNIVRSGHIRDFHATVLKRLGFDHPAFLVKSKGLERG